MTSTSIFSALFWRAAAERAIKAGAWAASSTLIANGVGLFNAQWLDVASVAGMAVLLSVLGSIVSDAATSGSGPSLTNAETLDPPPPGPDDAGLTTVGLVLVIVLVVVLVLLLGGAL